MSKNKQIKLILLYTMNFNKNIICNDKVFKTIGIISISIIGVKIIYNVFKKNDSTDISSSSLNNNGIKDKNILASVNGIKNNLSPSLSKIKSNVEIPIKGEKKSLFKGENNAKNISQVNRIKNNSLSISLPESKKTLNSQKEFDEAIIQIKKLPDMNKDIGIRYNSIEFENDMINIDTFKLKYVGKEFYLNEKMIYMNNLKKFNINTKKIEVHYLPTCDIEKLFQLYSSLIILKPEKIEFFLDINDPNIQNASLDTKNNSLIKFINILFKNSKINIDYVFYLNKNHINNNLLDSKIFKDIETMIEDYSIRGIGSPGLLFNGNFVFKGNDGSDKILKILNKNNIYDEYEIFKQIKEIRDKNEFSEEKFIDLRKEISERIGFYGNSHKNKNNLFTLSIQDFEDIEEFKYNDDFISFEKLKGGEKKYEVDNLEKGILDHLEKYVKDNEKRIIFLEFNEEIISQLIKNNKFQELNKKLNIFYESFDFIDANLGMSNLNINEYLFKVIKIIETYHNKDNNKKLEKILYRIRLNPLVEREKVYFYLSEYLKKFMPNVLFTYV